MALIEAASDAYVLHNNYFKDSFENFLSIFSPFQCLYMVRLKWDIVLSGSYDGWHKRDLSLDFFRRHPMPKICWLQKQISSEN